MEVVTTLNKVQDQQELTANEKQPCIPLPQPCDPCTQRTM